VEEKGKVAVQGDDGVQQGKKQVRSRQKKRKEKEKKKNAANTAEMREGHPL